MKYFSYCPGNGFEIHKTADSARKHAEDMLDDERGEAYDGWSYYVEQICWGVLKQHVVETMNRPRTDDDTLVSSDCDTIVDYELVDI